MHSFQKYPQIKENCLWEHAQGRSRKGWEKEIRAEIIKYSFGWPIEARQWVQARFYWPGSGFIGMIIDDQNWLHKSCN